MAKVSSGYSRTQIILHWAIAALVVFQYLGHDAIAEFVELVGITASSSEEIPTMARAHVLAGILTGALMVLRVIMRLVHGTPALPKEETPLMKFLAHATHFTLYAALFLMPMSGMAAWFGQIETALVVHNVLKVVLLAFVALHVAGALYHQLILKNHLIKRMMKPG